MAKSVNKELWTSNASSNLNSVTGFGRTANQRKLVFDWPAAVAKCYTDTKTS